jgi:uncharacterized membrane protein YfcA
VEITELLLLVLFGAVGGFLAGLLGVGGGIVFIPVFDYLFRSQGVEGEELVRYILANSFVCIFFSGLVSSYRQYRLKNFYPKHIIFTAIPAMIFAALLSGSIAGVDWYKEEYFKLFFVLLLLYTLIRSNLKKKKSSELETTDDNRPWKSVFVGSAAGTVSAFSGLGGGVAMIPLMTGFCRFDIRKAASISIGVIPLLAIPHLLVYAMATPSQVADNQIGYIDYNYSIPLIVGVLITSGFGVRLAHRIEQKYLKLIFAILIIILIIKYTLEITS